MARPRRRLLRLSWREELDAALALLIGPVSRRSAPRHTGRAGTGDPPDDVLEAIWWRDRGRLMSEDVRVGGPPVGMVGVRGP
jgi:hypothetical protein